MPRRPASRPAAAPPAPAPSGARPEVTPRGPRYWLVKTEPETFSFEDLWAAPGRTTGWDGIRNYQARNFLRDDLRPGDGVLVYHSNATPSGVAGVAEVVAVGAPDPTQFDPRSPGFDPKATRANPIWYQAELRAVARAPRFLALEELRGLPGLAGMALLRRGQRLSVQPVTAEEWGIVLAAAGLGAPVATRAAAVRRPGPRADRSR
ncbi:MAG: EVE domain-containing protein [Planctomycetes bacterium]|nr:EVE domain-containing protein [Planctomycetota bacterium]